MISNQHLIEWLIGWLMDWSVSLLVELPNLFACCTIPSMYDSQQNFRLWTVSVHHYPNLPPDFPWLRSSVADSTWARKMQDSFAPSTNLRLRSATMMWALSEQDCSGDQRVSYKYRGKVLKLTQGKHRVLIYCVRITNVKLAAMTWALSEQDCSGDQRVSYKYRGKDLI